MPNIGLVALFTVQPSSAAVAGPVLQRHRSMANCRASATAIFFLSEAPTLSFSKYFWRACQLACQRNSRHTASTSSTRTCLLPCRSIAPKHNGCGRVRIAIARRQTSYTTFTIMGKRPRRTEQPSLNPTGRLGVSIRTSTELVEFLPSIFRIWAPS